MLKRGIGHHMVSLALRQTLSQTRKAEKTPNILVADDNPFNIHIISYQLAKRNYRHKSVLNGKRAVEELCKADSNDENRFDVVLMDIEMPILNGYEALEEIK